MPLQRCGMRSDCPKPRRHVTECQWRFGGCPLPFSVIHKENYMNPTEAKFHDDLDEVASKLDKGIRSGHYTWADVQDRVKSKTSELASTTDQYLHEYTWTSLAVVACLSVLVGGFCRAALIERRRLTADAAHAALGLHEFGLADMMARLFLPDDLP